ncbi:MAG TPA: EAL domain-containing protein [Usitatibacter sp.]|nr:EAL domain-containing protein [Usitatibacter sp.]
MSLALASAATSASKEVLALIAKLHETGQRLEELTRGEVDTVAADDGRTFVLLSAQERLRNIEASRQSAILNALPAHIALLDRDGVIISVNQSWREFAAANAFVGPACGVGLNYLDVCEVAEAGEQLQARQAAAGIRSVLGGAAGSFSLEYPCDSAAQKRWFLMTVTPLADDRAGGAVVMHLDITRRKQAAEAVLASQKRLRDVFDGMGPAMFVGLLTPQGILIEINKAPLIAAGLEPEDVLGKRFDETYWWSESPEAQCALREAIAAGARGESSRFDLRSRGIGDGMIDVDFSLQPLRDETGAVAFLVPSGSVITERKQAENALQNSEEEFRTLAESMPQIVWITRPDGRNVYFNQRWVDYTGLTLAQSEGHGWNKPFHPDDQGRAWDAWQKATAAGGVYSLECRLRRADGCYRWWLVRGVPLQDAEGVIVKWFGTCTDIHDLKVAELEISRANQELRESERRFSDLLQNVELVSLMLDQDARITYCNDYLLELTGWQRAEVIGRDYFEVFVPPDFVDAKEIFAKLVRNQPDAWHHENEILTRSGGRRLIRWNNSVLRSGAGDVIGTASIGEDITEQKAAEVGIKRMNRVYAVLSGINTLIVRVRDREELFREACRIAVEHGGFRMAWIGMADKEAGLVRPVAAAGDVRDFFESARLKLSAADPQRYGLAGAAVQDMKTQVSNDIGKDPLRLNKSQMAARGINSVAIIPLAVGGIAIGVLGLYSADVGFFDEEEMRLLHELAGDISFAIDHIGKLERIDYLAYYDSLTGLANRSLFLERVTQHLRGAIAGGHKLAVFLVDLERFKSINDSLGQAAGDALLVQVAEWISRSMGDASLVARVGADHFAIVVPQLRDDGNVVSLLEKTLEAFFEHPFRLDGAVFRIAAKVGIAIFPDDGSDADSLLKNAEAALKKAKASGARYLFYTRAMTDTVAAKLTLENQLRRALDNEEFVLHYQPKASLATGKLTGVEALIRWNDPKTGLVPPGRFIPVLEETGLIHEVGRWALKKAIEDYLRWRAAGLAAVRIAVNVSPLQLRNRGFIDEIRRVIAVDSHAAAGLELELTESLIMEDVKHSIASLQAIRAMGVTIAIDDFGTGFSSLSYLARLPADTLKIDRSFVNDMTVTPEGLALVSTIISLAHSLKLKVVAEGVETEEQSRLLRLLNCDETQGFLFSKPVPGDVFETTFLAAPVALSRAP